jgi:hypothetical protein
MGKKKTKENNACSREGKKSFLRGLKLRVSGVKTMMRVDC